VGILCERDHPEAMRRKRPTAFCVFPFTVRNQFTATLSTLEAAKAYT
jgi:hypothetical protein